MWDLSSPTRDPTCVPYIARQSLSWIAREVPEFICLFVSSRVKDCLLVYLLNFLEIIINSSL